MTTIIRKRESFHKLGFKVTLTDYGKTIDDIEDIIFSVKGELTDEDNSIFIKKRSEAEIEVTGTDVLTVAVDWAETEYDQFVIDKEYNAGLFIKFIGDPVADENVKENFKLKIIQDFLQQN